MAELIDKTKSKIAGILQMHNTHQKRPRKGTSITSLQLGKSGN